MPCRAVNKAEASSKILFLVGDDLPHKNMFSDTLLVQGLLTYKAVVGFNLPISNPYLHPFGTEEANYVSDSQLIV